METIIWHIVAMFAVAALIGCIVWMCAHPPVDDVAQARFLLAKAYDQWGPGVPEDYRQALLRHQQPSTVKGADMDSYSALIARLEETADISHTVVDDLVKAPGVSDEMKWGQLRVLHDQTELPVWAAHLVSEMHVRALEPLDAMKEFRRRSRPREEIA